MPALAHPYLRYRTRMAHHALLHFIASLSNSLEIVALAFAPVLLGLCAAIALPGMLAVTFTWPVCCAILAAQAIFACAPALLLRQRLHPADAIAWERPLPVPPLLGWCADALVAGMLAGPLALVYAVSAAIWLYQWPDWLRPVAPQALAATAASLLLGWMLATLALARRRRLARAGARVRAHAAAPASVSAYVPRALRPLQFSLWRQLFWLPYWRADNPVGWQQTVLLLGALACGALWLVHAPGLPAALWGAAASALFILLTDRGDQAVREQVTLLRPVIAAWPLDCAALLLGARLFSLAPAALLLVAFAIALHAVPTGYSLPAARVWIGAAIVSSCAIVALPPAPRARVVLVMLSILILSAIGSEF
ncbi:MAG: hypothetical protein V4724_09690 [Pseudomonadota bacterium]